MKCERIGTFGVSWQFEDPAVTAPHVFGSVQRKHPDDIAFVVVGCTATPASRHANTWNVTLDEDAIEVAILPGERYFDGLRDSLLRRVAQTLGTRRAWMVAYRDA